MAAVTASCTSTPEDQSTPESTSSAPATSGPAGENESGTSGAAAENESGAGSAGGSGSSASQPSAIIDATDASSTYSGEPTEPSALGATLALTPDTPLSNTGQKLEAAAVTNAADPIGTSDATCAPSSIAVLTAQTGAASQFGVNILDGAQLAADKHNAANPDCQVTIQAFDTGSDPAKAKELAAKISTDSSVVAVIGPTTPAETDQALAGFGDAAPTILSPTGVLATTQKNAFNGSAGPDMVAATAAGFLVTTANLFKVCVISGESDSEKQTAESVIQGLGGSYDPACSGPVPVDPGELQKFAESMASESPDGVFFGAAGEQLEAVLKAIRTAGVPVTLYVSSLDLPSNFIDSAGDSSAGMNLFCGCVPVPAELAKDIETTNQPTVGPYTVESYDMATIVLAGVDSGATDRAALTAYVGSYSGQGWAGTYSWKEVPQRTDPPVWLYSIGVG